MSAAAIRWHDAAALGAALFLNVYSLERFYFPHELSASLPKLLAFALAACLLTVMAFYLGGIGAAQSNHAPLPLETALGTLLYSSALLSLLAPVGVLAASIIAGAFLELYAEAAGYPSLASRGPTSFGEQLILLGWAAWVASRGRAVVAASARFWAMVALVFLLGGCIRFWREVFAYVAADHGTVYWSDVASPLTDAAAIVLPLSFLAGLCRRADREPAPGVSSLLLGVGIGLMMILGCLSLAALSLKSPEGGFTLFYMLGRGAAAPYGEGRWLILTLTLLPLIRIAALTLTEGFASVRVPVPALAGFGCLAMLALASHKDWPIWQAIEPGTFPAAITAGVLCGKGLASVIARRGLSPWRRRAAEISGVCAGLIVAVAAQVDPALTRFVLPQNQPLETYVAALVVTSVVGLVWPASAKSPGMGGRLWTDALSRK